MTTKAASPAHDEVHARIDALLREMTLDEKVELLAGPTFWTTAPIQRLGIPAIKVSDGPNGARGGGSLVGGVRAASFPVAISLASTWNTALVEQIGQALAEEALSKGARVLLAPTVNIHRSPLNGRNFECYSEDPYLTARMGVAYIKGLQSKGVSATIKHFAGNESEFERNTINSVVGERALREIYLPPFEAAVKEAGTWAVMCAYNRLNGAFASENHWLLTDLLKHEWGFDGIVMSDWYATHSTSIALNAGLDLEMPGPSKFRGERLLDAMRSGKASQATIDESVRRMLRLIARVGAFDDPEIPAEQAIDRPEHRALIRKAGAEGIVLLQNNGLLPIDKQVIHKLAIIGPNAMTAQIMGGGSAQLNAHYRVSPYDGIVAQAGETIEIGYAPGCANHKFLPLADKLEGMQGFTIEYYNSPDLSGEVALRETKPGAEVMWFDNVAPGVHAKAFSARLRARFTATENGTHQFSLVSAGVSRLFVDRQLVVDNWDAWQPGDSYFGSGSAEAIGTAELKAGQSYDLLVEYGARLRGAFSLRAIRVGVFHPLGDDAIEHAAALAADADAALVFVGLNGDWDTEGADRPHMELVGQQNALVERVATANPNTVVVLQTGGPISMPWLDKVAGVLQAWYPGQECGNAIADVLFGAVNPSGKLPQTFPARLEDNPAFLNYPGENGVVTYGEGIFVGYRYYEKKKIAPLFPFGFGLSYTSFSYSNLRLSADAIGPDERLTVSVDVTNTGERSGQEIVQLYIGDDQARLARPEKELKGFAKVALEPGQTATIEIALDRRAFSYWDDARHEWVADPGDFEVLIGSSSAELPHTARVRLVHD